MSRANICVIYNPAAGRKQAVFRVARLRRVLGPRAEFRATTAPGMADELALVAAREGFPIVAAAGGASPVGGRASPRYIRPCSPTKAKSR